MRGLYQCYLRWAVPLIGGLLARRGSAYRSLSESPARFYDPDQVSRILTEAGFRKVSYSRLCLGAAASHMAEK